MLRVLGLGVLLVGLIGCQTTGVGFNAVPDIKLNPRDAQLVALAPQAIAPENFARVEIPYESKEKPGTIIVEHDERYLYFVLGNGRAVRYGVSVGQDAQSWVGVAYVRRKAEWPSWVAPAEMRRRIPSIPASWPGGPTNPLGARALYLFDEDGKDTLYRIHGTNEPESIGTAASQGCIRMLNLDVIELFERVPLGTKVIVRQKTSA